MRKVLFITLAVLLVGGILALAGCTPEETPTTNPLADRVTSLETGAADQASSLTSLTSQLNTLKAQVNGIVIPTIPNYQSDINSIESDIDALYAARNSLNASITNLQNQIDAIEIPDQYVPIDQATASAELGTNSLIVTTHAPVDMWVAFEINFRFNEVVELDPVDLGGSNSINDAVKWLDAQWFDGTDLCIRASVTLHNFLPQYDLHWNSDDGVWELQGISFYSIPTTITAGEDTKSVNVQTYGIGSGSFVTVVVHPIAEAGAPATW